MIETPQSILLGYESRRVFAGRSVLRSARGFRRGFNFTEVLFAVMILGMGFVMVAAMFPVTIRQTAMNMEDAAGANTAKDAVEALQAIALDPVPPLKSTSPDQAFPPTGGKYVAVSQKTLTDAWKWACRSNSVAAQNPRYGWVAMYRRDLDAPNLASPYVQVIIIAAQSRNRPVYSINDGPAGSGIMSDVLPPPLTPPPVPNYATLEPRQVKVNVTTTDGVSTVEFLPPGPTSGQFLAAPGAYLVIADDPTNPRSNGRIYQFGNLNGAGFYDLIPGADQLSSDPPHNNVTAFILGRGYTDPANKDYSYSGPAQDIGVYVSFIRVTAPAK